MSASVWMSAALVGAMTLCALALLGLTPLPGLRSRIPAASGASASPAGALAAEGAAAPRSADGPAPAAAVSAGVLIELVASMLESGVPVARTLEVLAGTDAGPVGRSLRVVATALQLGLPWQQAWAAVAEVPAPVQDLRAALTFAAVSGAPSASALRAASAQVRRAEHRRAEAAAERLAVHLMVPLGLCSLPAFVCWGIVPVLIGLVPDLLG